MCDVNKSLIEPNKSVVTTLPHQAWTEETIQFPVLSPGVKLTEGILTGPNIRKLIKGILKNITILEEEAGRAFKEVGIRFLGNNKDPNYKTVVKSMNKKYRNLGCTMRLKLHF